MARASTAAVSACAEAWRTLAFHQASPSSRIRAWLRRPDRELIACLSVPAVLSVFVALLVGAFYLFLMEEREQIINGAKTDVELVATLVAGDLSLPAQVHGNRPAEELLARAISTRPISKAIRVFLTDSSGKIIASYPDPHMTGLITDHLGNDQALTHLAEQAGVMRLSLPNGTEVLAAVHTVTSPFGQVAIVQPISDILSSWRSAVFRDVLLLTCVGSVFAALAAGYFWQGRRARRANISCKTLRDRFDMVLSRSRCGLWDWDLTQGRIEWSLSMYQILGMAPKVQSPADINALVHPDDGNLNEMLRLLSVRQKGTIDHVFRMRSAVGDWIWLRAKAEIIAGPGMKPHLVGVAIDITEPMILEQRTSHADMRLRDAIETISEAFVVWDSENRLVMCNSKFQRFNDLPDDAILPGTDYATVMARGVPPTVQAEVPLGIAQPLGARTFEAQLGDGRWLQINERRTKDGGYVSVGTDITVLKRNEEQLVESERRLLDTVVDLRKSRQVLETQAQDLAELAEKHLEEKAKAENANRAKSDFLANMSHELRTPLNAILGFSEIMMMESYGELGSPLYQEYCKDIHSSGHHLCKVITDLLEMSRLEAGRVRLEKSEFSLKEAVDTAIASVTAIAEADCVKICSSVVETYLFADRTALEKVIQVLLNNAVKYSPINGRVMIQAHVVDNALSISIEDAGVGISPEEIARLGRAFEQSDKTLKDGMRGSGLGLAIARSLVELHGGTMQIKSKPGVGTIVIVRLPNARSQTPCSPCAASTTLSAPTRQPRFALQATDRMPRKVSRTA